MLPDQLQARFVTYYTDHSPQGLRGSPGPLVALTGGWASSLYTFTVHPQQSSDAPAVTLVLKTYTPNLQGRAHALRECHALTTLRAAGYPVPQVILCEPDDHHIGHPLIVMEYIPSQPLWHRIETADQPTQGRLTRLFARQLLALHALDPQILEPTASPSHPFAFIEHELAQLRHDSQKSPHTTLIEIVQWLEDRKQAVPCHRPAILHRDYHPWNVLVDATERLWVIDWDWQIGDARFDLAWTLMLMRRSGFHSFSDAVHAEYMHQRGHSLDQLVYFEVLTTVRWLLNVLPSIAPESLMHDAARADFRAFLVEPVGRAVAFLRECTGVDVVIQM